MGRNIIRDVGVVLSIGNEKRNMDVLQNLTLVRNDA